MREMMSCVDADNRIRCPYCGKYATLAQLRRTPSLRSESGLLRVSLAPHCVRCADADGGAA